MKKVLLPFMLVLLAAVLVACGGKEESKPNDSAEKPAGQDGLLEEVLANGVLNVGTEGTYAPFSFHDESGKLTGYDVEVTQEIAKRLGVEVKFFETQWDAVFAGLDAKRFDMIANQVGINEERKEKYEFSQAYTHSNSVLVVRADEDIAFDGMEGKKAAQTLTSNYGQLAKANGAEIIKIDGFNQGVDLVISKRVDGTYNDKLSALDYLKQKPDAPIKIVEEEEISEDNQSESAFVFRQGNEDLIEEINKALDAMREDGTLKTISEKWFGEDVS
ncbi:amino acid ABC transporter substrate-binding protein [Sporosarcina sp. P26b]|uniref:amino acid ABC transporter substrate-binding protein n=1 Tax=Sporosarcina TaxID=1569 RepID=UPI000A17D645|nr:MULTISPECIES: amino acid ABC transporter substrate-binding protein [Sporosarcina]ARK21611.1 amino acid ABC transporter substrate-binding protein [Sporosarcina ureae]PIC74471.1 amino acid ABC transporter substrate-binding protein [Sporosarcina sp. P17b]PIC96621.1 amino acid ABC transporter substrate-binding protein [Sporosarcina sp. P26b]